MSIQTAYAKHPRNSTQFVREALKDEPNRLSEISIFRLAWEAKTAEEFVKLRDDPDWWQKQARERGE